MKLDNTVAAVITGGSSGLGAATARALAAKGVKVAIFDLQEEKGMALAAEIGGTFCEVNVTDDASVDAGFAKARAAHGQERILVNCAGTGNAIKTASRSKTDGSIKHFPLDAFNWLIQINLVGTFRCIAKSAAGMFTLEPMEDGERGAIVNTASDAYSAGAPNRLGNGTEADSAAFTLSGAPCSSGVLKMPGRMVLTRMPSPIRSRAIGRVMPTTPPFDALYAAWPIWPSSAATDAVLTIAPRSPSSIGSRDSMPAADLAMQRKVPTRLIWISMLNRSSGKCLISPVSLARLAVLIALPVPAQLIRMRSWPIAARALAKPASTDSSLVTLT